MSNISLEQALVIHSVLSNVEEVIVDSEDFYVSLKPHSEDGYGDLWSQLNILTEDINILDHDQVIELIAEHQVKEDSVLFPVGLNI